MASMKMRNPISVSYVSNACNTNCRPPPGVVIPNRNTVDSRQAKARERDPYITLRFVFVVSTPYAIYEEPKAPLLADISAPSLYPRTC